MNRSFVATSSLIVLLLGTSFSHLASAQFQSGGVDHPGVWYVGEGLKIGDQFAYKLCFVDYKDCSEFRIDFWIRGDKKVGTEEKWDASVVVYDGSYTIKGNMELGKVAPEPSGGSAELGLYRGAFKSSIVWLSAYATADTGELTGKGSKKFSSPSWGKIANIGGDQIRPVAIEKITVLGGTFETVRLEWRSGGLDSKVWVVDNFPFPVKASTWTQVSEGVPPQEYRFELLDYKENVSSDPFVNIKPVLPPTINPDCQKNYDLVSKKGNTKQFTMIVDLKYGPSNPKPGCAIEWFLNFKNKFDQEKFINQVHYDIVVVDEQQRPIRSIAQDEGRQKFFTTSGQVHKFTTVDEKPGIAHYVIWIYGTNPEQVVPPADELDFFLIDIPIGESVKQPQSPNIPTWIRNNAGWWSDGTIDDNAFVSGIQWLVSNGILKIPPTTPGGSGGDQIPTWIRNNAGWWSDGTIDDKAFVSGIQWLVSNGIIKVTK